jgi:hypothetical protein
LSRICLVVFAGLASATGYAGGMKDTRWLEGMHQLDTLTPPVETQGETVYTLFLRDFLGMPEVDFSAATATDRSVRALLN